MKRAQMEMVGLIFIVIILVVGIVLYLRFSIPDGPTVPVQELQSVTSFLVAAKETTIPACGTSVERTIAACLEDRTLCTSRDPCYEAQVALETLAAEMLPLQGFTYNLSVDGSSIMIEDGCVSADPRIQLLAAPRIPIVFAGSAQRQLILAICL